MVIKSPDNCFDDKTNKIQDNPHDKTNKNKNESTKNNKITPGFVDMKVAEAYTETISLSMWTKYRKRFSFSGKVDVNFEEMEQTFREKVQNCRGSVFSCDPAGQK